MINKSKLWALISTFSRRESVRFQKFLESDYHNQRKVMVRLYKFLSDHLAAVSPEEEISPSSLWPTLYPGQPVREAKLRHHLSELYALAKDFLACESLKRTPEMRNLMVGKEMIRRNNKPLFVFEYQKAESALKKKALLTASDYWIRFQWAQETTSIDREAGRKEDAELTTHFAGLDEWIVLQKLRQACTYLSRQSLLINVAEIEPDIPFLDRVLDFMTTQYNSGSPLLELYYFGYQLFDIDKEDSLKVFLSQLSNFEDLMPKVESKALYMLAINCAIKQLNVGKKEFIPQLNGLYKMGLEKGWLFERGELSPWTFKNIVSVGLKMGDLENVESFISNYTSKIPENYRFAYRLHALAELYFEQERYRKVLETLRFVNNRDPITHPRVRMIYVKASYELHERTMLDIQLDNFERYLRSSKQSTYHQSRYRTFIKTVKQLANLPPSPSSKRKTLRSQIMNASDLLEKSWLLEKCDEY